jgi:hypothetical protein
MNQPYTEHAGRQEAAQEGEGHPSAVGAATPTRLRVTFLQGIGREI